MLLTEADLHGDYSGSHLAHAPGTLRYGVDLFQGAPVTSDRRPLDAVARRDRRRARHGGRVDASSTTSRRRTQLGGEDTSWIKPGVSSWSWLTDWNSPKDEARQRDFIDLSARNGWEYVLLDEGWDASWVPRTVRYAETKGVDVIIWFHSRDLRTQEQRDEWLPRIASWGVRGIKVDFMDTDSQAIHQWYDQIAADTAANHLMINFHGASLPTGMQRTWPHIMSYEAVRGAENGISPARSLMVPFTRNVVGSMDWTPVTFSRGNGNSSKAHEVAMSIVYESGWQHLSDKPEAYAAEPNAEPFLQNLPATLGRDAARERNPGLRRRARPASGRPLVRRRHARRLRVSRCSSRSTVRRQEPHRRPPDRRRRQRIGDGATDHAAPRRTRCCRSPPRTTAASPPSSASAKPRRESCLDPAEPLAGGRPHGRAVRRPRWQPGSTVELTASFSVEADATKVAMTPVVPEGWVVDGRRRSRRRSSPAGDALEASWTVTVPADGVSGTVEIPVEVDLPRSAARRAPRRRQSTLWVTPQPLDGVNHLSDLEWLEQ